MPEEIISSTNNIKVIKKKTIKGKSESCLKKKNNENRFLYNWN